MSGLYLGLGAVALAAIWLAASYRGLIASRRGVDEAWAHMETQLRRRHDLVPALVAAVRQQAPGESAAVDRLLEAVAGAEAAHTPFERTDAERRLVSTLGTVAALGERHPLLAGTGPFVTLQAQLADVSDEIQGARRIYNAEVRLYLSRRAGFPASVLASFGEFPDRPYFELDNTRERLGLRLTPAAVG